jgi:hypothetical protein
MRSLTTSPSCRSDGRTLTISVPSKLYDVDQRLAPNDLIRWSRHPAVAHDGEVFKLFTFQMERRPRVQSCVWRWPLSTCRGPRQPSPSPLLPFGQTVLSREDYFGREDVGTGAFG